MVDIEEIELFVPGRIGLIGELSDLVSPYLSQNPELPPGRAIACTIDKGIYSKSKKSNKLIYEFKDIYFEIDLIESQLKNEIEKGSFVAYICGTVLYLKNSGYKIGGIHIFITKMDLPIKKGLSSSAAICLTVAKAYNSLYELNLSDDDLKNIAYYGEHLAGSKCGKLDQNSIMNNNCSSLTFYEENVVSTPVLLEKDLYVLIVDLNSNKDTRIIMSSFNRALPIAKKEKDKLLLDIIGNKNVELVEKAISCLELGDLKIFGKCLSEAQLLLDKAKVACKEFKAPALHLLLSDGFVQCLTYGGKSIGSGGDGSLLLVCENAKTQNTLESYIKEVYGMDSISFCINKSSKGMKL